MLSSTVLYYSILAQHFIILLLTQFKGKLNFKKKKNKNTVKITLYVVPLRSEIHYNNQKKKKKIKK